MLPLIDAGGPPTSSCGKKTDKAGMRIVRKQTRTADTCEELAGHQQPVGYMRMSAAENVGPEKLFQGTSVGINFLMRKRAADHDQTESAL